MKHTFGSRGKGKEEKPVKRELNSTWSCGQLGPHPDGDWLKNGGDALQNWLAGWLEWGRGPRAFSQ